MKKKKSKTTSTLITTSTLKRVSRFLQRSAALQINDKVITKMRFIIDQDDKRSVQFLAADETIFSITTSEAPPPDEEKNDVGRHDVDDGEDE